MNILETCSLLMSHPRLKQIMFDVIKSRTVLCQAVVLSHISHREAATFLEQLGEERRYLVCRKIVNLHEVPRWEMNQEIQIVVDEINTRVHHGVKKDYYKKTKTRATDVMKALYEELDPAIKKEMERTVQEEEITF